MPLVLPSIIYIHIYIHTQVRTHHSTEARFRHLVLDVRGRLLLGVLEEAVVDVDAYAVPEVRR